MFERRKKVMDYDVFRQIGERFWLYIVNELCI